MPKKFSDTPGLKALSSDSYETIYGEGIMVGYRYYDAKGIEPLFPFGHGLSYTSFSYSDLKLSKREMNDEETVAVSVEITNTGERVGAEIVQFYVSFPASRTLRAKNELKGFDKVFLQPGETKTVGAVLDKDSFCRYDEAAGAWLVDEGEYEIKAAASSRDIRSVATLVVTNKIPRYPEFDLNTSIGEITSYPDAKAALVRFVKPYIKSSFLSQMPGSDEEIVDQLITRFDDMPLRALSLTGNQLPVKAVEQLTELLNRAAKGRKGLGLLFK
jgi:beta-glucosidase